MRKSIGVVTVVLLIGAAPAARGADRTSPSDVIIKTLHTNVNVIEGTVGGEKTLDVAVTTDPRPGSNTYAVNYEIVPVTATRGQDFDAPIGKGTLQLDSAKATIPIKIKGDVFDETNETIRIDLFNAHCTGGGTCDLDSDPNPRPGFVTIADDDGKPTPGPQIDVVNGTADAQKDKTCAVEGALDYGWDKPITVDYKTEDLEATHPDDYDKSEGTMTLSPGQIRKSVIVPIHADRKVSTRKDRFVVNFSNAKGGTLSKTSGQCTLTDSASAADTGRHARRRNRRP